MDLFIFSVFIWLTGYMFACPLCFDSTKGFEGTIVALAMLIFWPLILGATLREKLGWRDDGRGAIKISELR